MTQFDIHSDDPMEMVWAVREKIYEETKNMNHEEFSAYLHAASERVREKTERLRTQNIDIPFLRKKVGL